MSNNELSKEESAYWDDVDELFDMSLQGVSLGTNACVYLVDAISATSVLRNPYPLKYHLHYNVSVFRWVCQKIVPFALPPMPLCVEEKLNNISKVACTLRPVGWANIHQKFELVEMDKLADKPQAFDEEFVRLIGGDFSRLLDEMKLGEPSHTTYDDIRRLLTVATSLLPNKKIYCDIVSMHTHLSYMYYRSLEINDLA